MNNEDKFLITYGLQNFVTVTATTENRIFAIEERQSRKMVSHAKMLIAENYGATADIRMI